MSSTQTSMARKWEVLVADKKIRQKASIPKEWIILPSDAESPSGVMNVLDFLETCGLLSSREIEITNTQIDVLLARLAKGEWTCVEVTTAFSKRAVIAHQLTNCLTEIFVERALVRAAEVDAHLKATGKPIGPLHGLPISLKDQVNLKGIESSTGYASWLGNYAPYNSVLADVLEALGAVFYVKTNVPQTLMWAETFNLIFGRTTNPHNRSLTSGGSSGGEGALIALKGSPLGVGSDIGGSIRIPSAFCGLYGFRPSIGLVPYSGSTNTLEGQDSILSVLGPLSTSIHGLKVFMQAVMSQKAWLRDPLVLRRGWNQDGYELVDHGGVNNAENGQSPRLCFAIMWNDGVIDPHPPITRGLLMAKEALVQAGHKVIDWNPLNHKDIVKVASAIYSSGAIDEFRSLSSSTGEPLIKSMVPGEEFTGLQPDYQAQDKLVTAYELWQVHKKRLELRTQYAQHWLSTERDTGTGRPVDAIIAPVAPYTAVPHGRNSYAGYTIVWNLLDYPALVIPVDKINPALDVKKARPAFFNDEDKTVWDMYDPSHLVDAPIAFQVVGRTQEDEAVIRMAEIVDEALKNPPARAQKL